MFRRIICEQRKKRPLYCCDSNICSGELYGSVAYFPENYGKYLIPAVMGLINKQSVPKHVVLPTTLLTAKNVGKYYPKSACS